MTIPQTLNDLEQGLLPLLSNLHAFQQSFFSQVGRYKQIKQLENEFENVPADVNQSVEIHEYYNPDPEIGAGYMAVLKSEIEGYIWIKFIDFGLEERSTDWHMITTEES